MKRAFSLLLLATLLLSCNREVLETRWLGGSNPSVVLYSYDKDKGMLTAADTLIRGAELQVFVNRGLKFEGMGYLPVLVGKKELYVPESVLAADRDAVVAEKIIYVQTAASLIDDLETSHINGFLGKGTELQVLEYDRVQDDGIVHRYKVNTGKHQGWVFGKYCVPDKEEAMQVYDRDAETHAKVRNPFKGGLASGCEFRPCVKPVFEGNRLPNPCNGFYLSINPALLKNIDAYIALADSTRINAFVIDIKDNECPGYKAEAMQKYSPSNYAHAGKDKEELYKSVVKKLHAKGYYVIGRITCFKDSFYAKDHPATCISERSSGRPFFHNKSYWPSAYSRDVWQFNVELAKESVRKMGFDEINFDYVRFPDKMISIDSQMDFHNVYGESKVQAVQNFVRYACDELHELGVYVSIDVFGESANPGYTTAYGQYWPAISTVADIICGMPYPDHFSDNYYGISKPWNHPYELLKAWGRRVSDRQAESASPAVVRTWIQAYHVMRFVDPAGLDNNANFIERQVRGLYDSGLTGGFQTWIGSCNIDVYRRQKEAYSLDFPSLPAIGGDASFITR